MKNRVITVIGSISESSFIKSDINILQKHCKVYSVNTTGSLNKSKLKKYIQYLQLGFNIIFKAIPLILISDSVLIWFADLHAVIPIIIARIFQKQCVVVIGGYEVSNMPEINYGKMREPLTWRGNICKWVINHSDACIVPSQSYYDKTLRYIKDKNKLYISPCCVKSYLPLTLRHYMKKDIVLMVAQSDIKNYLLKDIPSFNNAAGKIKNASFYIIGRYDKEISDKYNNIKYLGLISHEEVLYWMNLSKVYCQISKTESFGISILESISAGCIPIITNVDNLPLLIDDNGIVINSIDELIPAINISLSKSQYNLHIKISNNAIIKIQKFCKMRENTLKKLLGV